LQETLSVTQTIDEALWQAY